MCLPLFSCQFNVQVCDSGAVSDGTEEQERFSLVDISAVGELRVNVCAHARVCDHLPVQVLHFTNDLTMPPGAGLALRDTFVCLSPYQESVPRVVYLKVSQSVFFLKHVSIENIF